VNVVFDLGGVVVTWEPDGLIAGVFPDPDEQRTVRTAILGHPDWLEIDRGTLGREEAIERAVERTGLARRDVTELMLRVPLSLNVIPDTIDLIRRVRERGHRLLALSNMHPASIEHVERKTSVLDEFEGAVVSCRIGMVKPEPEIYEHLLSEYRLDAAETVFIDDTHHNLPPAAELGIHTIEFADPAQCERELADLGCLG